MSNDPYKSAQRDMDMLLKVEGGVSPGKRSMPKNLAQELGAKLPGRNQGKVGQIEGEMATQLRATPQPNLFAVDNEFVGGIALPDVSSFSDETAAMDMIRALTEKAGLSHVNISDFDLTDEERVKRLTSYIAGPVARDRCVFPVDEREEHGKKILTVAIYDPLNVNIIDDLRLMLPEHEIEVVVCDEGDITDAINRHYGSGDESIEAVIDSLQEDENQSIARASSVMGPKEVDIDPEDLANAAPVIKLVNLLLIQAISDNASDLHVEPFATTIRIRYRVDGVLREIPSPPKSLQLGLISRFKVMANLNISETRTPQDGRIRLNIKGREIDLRVATVPTVHGESIVMRILDKSNMMIGIQQLGLQAEVLSSFMKICKRPNGIVLVTGPTGSGKTTTLYSVLTEIFDPSHKFITVEDPVEYELPGIVQVNVNNAVGLTFGACLRSILRQDPDTILVGEIRDVETAQIAIQAALTGHMVLSTLHTNSAASTVTRLMDMGIEPFLLTSTLQVVVGQRLVRTVCQSCRSPYIPTDEELAAFGVSRDEVADIIFSHGRGCDECNMTGYRGRIGLYEVLPITETINELILQRSSADDLHALGVHERMMTMRQDGWLKVCYGITTFDEVNRQTHPETEESIVAERESVKRSLAAIAKAQRQREAEDNDTTVDADPSTGQPLLLE